MENLIFVINPGSTSTKIALYKDTDKFKEASVEHKTGELKKYKHIIDQVDFRLKYIFSFLSRENISINSIDAVVGRGGLLKPIPGGTYEVNNIMINELKSKTREEHASNLGAILAKIVAEKASCPAYIVDPVVVDELEDKTRISGLPQIKRRAIWHALNQKAVARKYARDNNKEYEKIKVIVAHLGGGISVGMHNQGKVIDVNNALSGEGPFSPNRSGGVPSIDLLNLCFSGEYSYQELKDKLMGNGGVIAYLKTNSIKEVENRIENGDKKAQLIFEALIYQVSKEIASLAPAVNGQVEAIILTGGIAYSRKFTEEVKKKVSFIAPVKIYPGADELTALATGAYRVLTGQEKALTYR